MLELNIKNETSRLRAVILGTAKSNGGVPNVEDCYDPKSIEHVLSGTYPKEDDMMLEMEAVAEVLKKYNVQVFRPDVINSYNQIFSRDTAFVIDNILIRSNILPDREKEYMAIQNMISHINPENIEVLPEKCHIEGGDVMPWNEYIFVGTYSGNDYSNYITARTNIHSVNALQELFPHKKVKSFELDCVQLHGNETPEYISQIRTTELFSKPYKIEIIKAFSVDENFDFKKIKAFENICDFFLFDTKGENYGGNGIKFNWEILQKYKGNTPFLLSGGISKQDAEEIKSIHHKSFEGVDVNSGFEIEPGMKNINDIKEFKYKLK